MKICTWRVSWVILASKGWDGLEHPHHTKQLTFNFNFHLPIFSQTPVAAVSESFTNHLVRPQKTRASGKEGKFETEGLCGIALPSSHLPQPVHEISPSGSAYFKWAPYPVGYWHVTLRKQVFIEKTCKRHIWNPGLVFRYQLFSSKMTYTQWKNRPILVSCLFCPKPEESIYQFDSQ